MSVKFSVNGKSAEFDGPEDAPLLWVVREHLGLTGSKFGCGIGACGACTMHVDGAPQRTCIMPIMMAQGRQITTIEGLGSIEKPHVLQQAFIEEQAAQCGYCINGMIMSAKELLDRNPQPSEGDVRTALAGNLCRCGTHNRIVRAVLRAAQTNAKMNGRT